MSQIFIAYNRLDKLYVNTLAKNLQQRGYAVWFDRQVDYGEAWSRVFEEEIASSSIVLVIMTPHSLQSRWVQSEIAQARNMGKPVYALLLEGDEWGAEDIDKYFDVRGNKQPSEEFYAALDELIKVNNTV